MGLNAVRTVAYTAQHGNYTKARLQNYAHLQLLKRLAIASLNGDEAKEVLKSYAVHNYKFEEKIYREQLSEFHKGRKWDETEEDDTRINSEKEKTGFLVPDVLSGVTSLLSGWWNGSSTTTSTTTATTTTNTEAVRRGRTTRGDDVSNMLWNMRGANML